MKKMHQSVPTGQQHEEESVLPTCAKAIKAGPSNQPSSAPMHSFLSPSATVQVPLDNPPVRPPNADPQNGKTSPAPNTAIRATATSKLLNNNHLFS